MKIWVNTLGDRETVAGWERCEAPPCRWTNDGKSSYHLRICILAKQDQCKPYPRETVKPDGSCIQCDDGSIWKKFDKHFDRDTQSGLQDRETVHSAFTTSPTQALA